MNNGTSWPEAYQFIPPIGPNEYIEGNFTTSFPTTNDTKEILCPVFAPGSENTKFYLFAGFKIPILRDSIINGKIDVNMWVMTNEDRFNNPWNAARGSFKFEFVTINTVTEVITPKKTYMNKKELVTASMNVNNLVVKTGQAIKLAIWYEGEGELNVVFGSIEFPSHIKVPINSVRIKNTIEKDLSKKEVYISTELSNCFGLSDIQTAEMNIYFKSETIPISTQKINNTDLFNYSLLNNVNFTYIWYPYVYSDIIENENNYQFEIRIEIFALDNNTNVWQKNHTVLLQYDTQPYLAIPFIEITALGIIMTIVYSKRDILLYGLYSFSFSVFGIIKKRSPKCIDEYSKRREMVYKIINQFPGLCFIELLVKTNLNRKHLTIALRELEGEDRITFEWFGIKKRYVTKGNELKLLKYGPPGSTDNRIINLLADHNDGLYAKEIIELLYPLRKHRVKYERKIYYNLKILTSKRFIRIIKDNGKGKYYHMHSPKVQKFIRNIISANFNFNSYQELLQFLEINYSIKLSMDELDLHLRDIITETKEMRNKMKKKKDRFDYHG